MAIGLAVLAGSLSGCGDGMPRTPYEARKQVEDAAAKLNQTADTTVETAKDVIDATSEAAAPGVEVAKEGLTALGDAVLGAADKAKDVHKELTKPVSEQEPPPANVTQPAVRMND